MADVYAAFVEQVLDSGKRTYIMTARRMISGLVLKYLKGSRFSMSAA